MAQNPAPNFAALAKDNSPQSKIILAAMKIIYSNPDGFVKLIAQGGDPKHGIAIATKAVIDKIVQSIKGVPPQTIQQVLPAYVKAISPMIVYILMELAVAAGVMPDPKGQGGAQGAPPAAPGGAQQGLVAQAQAQPQPQPAGA